MTSKKEYKEIVAKLAELSAENARLIAMSKTTTKTHEKAFIVTTETQCENDVDKASHIHVAISAEMSRKLYSCAVENTHNDIVLKIVEARKNAQSEDIVEKVVVFDKIRDVLTKACDDAIIKLLE